VSVVPILNFPLNPLSARPFYIIYLFAKLHNILYYARFLNEYPIFKKKEHPISNKKEYSISNIQEKNIQYPTKSEVGRRKRLAQPGASGYSDKYKTSKLKEEYSINNIQQKIISNIQFPISNKKRIYNIKVPIKKAGCGLGTQILSYPKKTRGDFETHFSHLFF